MARRGGKMYGGSVKKAREILKRAKKAHTEAGKAFNKTMTRGQMLKAGRRLNEANKRVMNAESNLRWALYYENDDRKARGKKVLKR